MSTVDRGVGLTGDAGWEIGVSRTFPHDVDRVWDLLTSADGVALWLGAGASLAVERGARYRTQDGIVGEVRSFRSKDRIRLTWRRAGDERDSTVQVAIAPRDESTLVRFHHERLVDSAERERMREHWTRVLDGFEDVLRADSGVLRQSSAIQAIRARP